MINSQSPQEELGHATKMDMRSGSGWIKFFSCNDVHFRGTCITISIPFFTRNLSPGTAMPYGLSPSSLGLVIILMALLLFLLGYFLFSYATHLKNASINGTISEMEKGLPAYKNYFLVVLIMTILSVVTSLTTLTNTF